MGDLAISAAPLTARPNSSAYLPASSSRSLFSLNFFSFHFFVQVQPSVKSENFVGMPHLSTLGQTESPTQSEIDSILPDAPPLALSILKDNDWHENVEHTTRLPANGLSGVHMADDKLDDLFKSGDDEDGEFTSPGKPSVVAGKGPRAAALCGFL